MQLQDMTSIRIILNITSRSWKISIKIYSQIEPLLCSNSTSTAKTGKDYLFSSCDTCIHIKQWKKAPHELFSGSSTTLCLCSRCESSETAPAQCWAWLILLIMIYQFRNPAGLTQLNPPSFPGLVVLSQHRGLYIMLHFFPLKWWDTTVWPNYIQHKVLGKKAGILEHWSYFLFHYLPNLGAGQA